MSKGLLCDTIYDQFGRHKYINGLTETQAIAIVNTFFEVMRSELKTNKKFMLASIGTFRTVEQPARKALNPKTGAPIKVGKRKTVRFKASPSLRAFVQNKKKAASK